jgi:hypothetical protein
MAAQFIFAFIVIALIVSLGVVMAEGIIKSKAKQDKLSGQPHDRQLNSKK